MSNVDSLFVSTVLDGSGLNGIFCPTLEEAIPSQQNPRRSPNLISFSLFCHCAASGAGCFSANDYPLLLYGTQEKNRPILGVFGLWCACSDTILCRVPGIRARLWATQFANCEDAPT